MNLPVLDYTEHFFKYLKRIGLPVFFACQGLIKAGIISCVAGCADLMHLCQKSIIVAVYGQGLYILIMSGSLTFHPQRLPASAEVSHHAPLQCQVKCLFIHIGKHENLAGLIILDNDRKEAIAV